MCWVFRVLGCVVAVDVWVCACQVLVFLLSEAGDDLGTRGGCVRGGEVWIRFPLSRIRSHQ